MTTASTVPTKPSAPRVKTSLRAGATAPLLPRPPQWAGDIEIGKGV